MKFKYLKTTPVAWLFGLSLIVIFAGCSNDDDNNNPVGPGGGSTTKTVYPAQGDSITYGSATVNIPPNALSDTTDITVAALETAPSFNLPPNTVVMGQVYHFTPDSLVFNQMVEVEFDYTDAQLGTHDESTVTIYTFDVPGTTPVALTGLVRNPATNNISGLVGHFSYFYLGVSTQEGGVYPPPQGGNPVGDWSLSTVDYEFYNPLPDTIQFNITGSGTGTLHIGASDFEEWFGTYTQTYLAYYYFGQWWVFEDTTRHDTTHASGTYTISADTILAHITASDTDPDLIGTTQHFPFSVINSNELILYFSEGEPSEPLALQSWWVLNRR